VVFNFLVNSEPGLVPPAVGDWAADQFAASFGGRYELVERGEVCWYMGRLGVTMKDVLGDAAARRCLAQALNVRFFVFGSIQQTSSFDVATHLVDADTGARTGTGKIHVQDHQELKLRMTELAQQLGAPGAEQAQLARQGQESEKALNEIRKLQKAGQYTKAAEMSRAALQQSPNNVALQQLLAESEKQAQQAALAQAEAEAAKRRQAEAEAALKRQQELARQTEEARRKAEQEAKSRDEAARRAQETQKQKAADELTAQGQRAMQQKNYEQAVASFQSAVALKPSDGGFRDLAQARARLDEANRARAAEEQAKKDAELKKQREQAQVRVEEEKRKRDAEEQARRKAEEARQAADYGHHLDAGKAHLTRQNYDGAAAEFQAARKLKATPEVEKLLADAHDAQALAEAKKKGDAAKAEAEKRLAEEKAKRAEAEAKAKKNQDDYTAALKLAQKAMTEKHYDEAVAHYQEAGKLFRTDVVLTGLKQAEELRDRDKAQREAEQRQRAEAQKRDEHVKKLLADGQKALDARQYDAAVKAFKEASQVAPGDVAALTALGKAEQARDEFNARNAHKAEEDKQAAFRKLRDSGKSHLAARQYDAAVADLKQALALNPTDADTSAALRDAEKARQDTKQAADAAAKKREQEERAAKARDLVAAARKAVEARDYNTADKHLADAGKLAPEDPAVTKALQDLAQARKAAAADDAKLKQRKADHDLAMDAGQKALKAKNYEGAVNSFTEALRLVPGDPAATAQLENAKKLRAEEAEAKKREEFNRLMGQAQASVAAKKYDDAVKLYTEALKLQPADAAAAKGLKDAQQAIADIARADAEKKKHLADYQQAIQHGKTALAAKKYDEAIKAFADAGKLMPGDKDAAALLKEAENAKAAADAEARKKQEEAKRREEFNRLITQAQAATTARNHADAVKFYTEALKLQPGDAQAVKGLKDAQQALDAAKAPPPPPPPPPPNPQAEYAKHMQAGAAADKQKKFDDAVKAYKEALRQVPNDAKATAALKSAEFNLHLSEGDKHLAARKFAEAVKEYEEALKLFPDSADAKAGLKKAKEGKP
jgi:tetratricopeptide (TPR) repeat protein